MLLLWTLTATLLFNQGSAASTPSAQPADPAFACTFTANNGLSSNAIPACTKTFPTPTLDDARRLAHTYAPIVNFHPLEPYYLEDPSVYFQKAQFVGLPLYWTYLGGTDTTNATQIMQDAIRSPALMAALEKTYITVLGTVVSGLDTFQNQGALLAGAPFELGLSTAKVYYNVFEESGSWVYNFYLFYPFNGCSNQELSVAFDGAYSAVNYLLCPPGVHESDWERVTVVVCPSTKNITRVQYPEHGWSTNLDCTKETCPMENGHPIAYAALSSHASYPKTALNMVYKKVDLAVLPSLDGVFIVDRTMVDPKKRFVPTQDNIVELLKPNKVTADSSQIWAAFPGSWGGHQVNPGFSMDCLSDNQTTFVTCPNNKAYSLMSSCLGLDPDNQNVSDLVKTVQPIIVAAVNGTFSGGEIFGPWQKDSSYTWNNSQTFALAPLWHDYSATNLPTCAMTGDPSSTVRVPVAFKSTDLVKYLWSVALGTIGFAFLAGTVLMLLSFYSDYSIRLNWLQGKVEKQNEPRGFLGSTKRFLGCVPCPTRISQAEAEALGPDDPAAFAETVTHHEQVTQETRDETRLFSVVRETVWVRVLLGALGLFFFICGASLLMIGITNLFVLMEDIHSSSIWNSFKKISTLVVILIGIFDLVVCVATFAAQPAIWAARGKNFPMWISRLYIVIGSMTTIVIMTAMLLFGLGVVVSVLRLVFAGICEQVAEVAISTGVCIDLYHNGLDNRVLCGANVADFCNKWNDLRVDKISIGAAFLLWSHVVFLVLTAKGYFLSHPFRWTAVASADRAEGAEGNLAAVKP